MASVLLLSLLYFKIRKKSAKPTSGSDSSQYKHEYCYSGIKPVEFRSQYLENFSSHTRKTNKNYLSINLAIT